MTSYQDDAQRHAAFRISAHLVNLFGQEFLLFIQSVASYAIL